MDCCGGVIYVVALKLGPAEEAPQEASSSAGETRSERRRSARKRRWVYRVLIGLGALLVLAAAALQLNATLWTIHSQQVGHSLVEGFLKNKALAAPVTAPKAPAAGTAALADCSESGPGGARRRACC